MKKRVVAVTFLLLSVVTGLHASRRNTELRSPVCRFMQFYVAAEKSEMSAWERVVYSLAVATSKPAGRCS